MKVAASTRPYAASAPRLPIKCRLGSLLADMSLDLVLLGVAFGSLTWGLNTLLQVVVVTAGY